MANSQMTINLKKVKKETNNLIDLTNAIINHTIYEEPPACTFLSYILTSGTQFINTTITPDSTTDIEVVFKNTDANENPQYERLFGQVDTAGNARYQVEWASATQVAVGIAGSTTKVTVDARNDFKTFKMTGTGVVTLNGSQLANLARSETNGYYIWLGRGYDRYSSIYFKSCRIWKNGALVRDLVPCRRDSDSVVCMYDKVSKSYFLNAGTGTFIAGEEIE